MKQLLIFLVLLFCLSTPCLAKWDEADTALLTMRLIDWGQTRDISTKKYKSPYVSGYDGSQYLYHENNPILGEHPSTEKVDTYFASAIAIDFFISRFATKSKIVNKFKKYYQQYMICNTFCCITGNYNLGVKVKF